ncbi:MAG: DUF3291 domain-containing protein [Acidobacteria bacterium]|nr:DUF3291 domain-containing protein [Acidobacteriota bacterium]
MDYYIAQINIARMLAPLDSPIMADFVASLDEINALADESPGFVWRFQTEEGNATYLRPYEDDRILVNFSVWKSIEDLKNYVYKSAHSNVMRRRKEWFEKFNGSYMALWWIKSTHIPSVLEAKEKLDYLNKHGESPLAFTFRQPFAPPNLANKEIIVTPFEPCPSI